MGRVNTRFSVFLLGALLHLQAAAAPDVVALTISDGLPVATVKIGAATTRLIIASGDAPGISIPQTIVRASGSVTLLDTKTSFRDIHGIAYELQHLVANRVVIGSTPLEPIQGRLQAEWRAVPEGFDAGPTKARPTGTIGLAAFGERSLMFDYAQAQLSIYAPGEGPKAGDQGWQALRLGYDQEGPSVRLRVNGKTLRFVLDTGATINLVDADAVSLSDVPCPPAEAARFACGPDVLRDVRDESGRPVEAFRAERMSFKGVPFDGILGAPFFQRHRILIDLTGRRLLIAPSGPDAGDRH